MGQPQIIRCIVTNTVEQKNAIPHMRAMTDHSSAGPYITMDAVQFNAFYNDERIWSAEQALSERPNDPEHRFMRVCVDRINETEGAGLGFWNYEPPNHWDYATREDTYEERWMYARALTSIRMAAVECGCEGMSVGAWNRPIEVNDRVHRNELDTANYIARPDFIFLNAYRDRGEDDIGYISRAHRTLSDHTDRVIAAVTPYTPSAKWISPKSALRKGQALKKLGCEVMLYLNTSMLELEGEEPEEGPRNILAFIDSLMEGLT